MAANMSTAMTLMRKRNRCCSKVMSGLRDHSPAIEEPLQRDTLRRPTHLVVARPLEDGHKVDYHSCSGGYRSAFEGDGASMGSGDTDSMDALFMVA